MNARSGTVAGSFCLLVLGVSALAQDFTLEANPYFPRSPHAPFLTLDYSITAKPAEALHTTYSAPFELISLLRCTCWHHGQHCVLKSTKNHSRYG